MQGSKFFFAAGGFDKGFGIEKAINQGLKPKCFHLLLDIPLAKPYP